MPFNLLQERLPLVGFEQGLSEVLPCTLPWAQPAVSGKGCPCVGSRA